MLEARGADYDDGYDDDDDDIDDEIDDDDNFPPCTMDQALKKIGIKDFAKNDYLSSHFLKPELFQMKIFGCYLLFSFTFNLYLGMI